MEELPFTPPAGIHARLTRPQRRDSGPNDPRRKLVLAPIDREDAPPEPGVEYCGAPRSVKSYKVGQGTCRNRAGERTDHPGWGPCHVHGGNRKKYLIEYIRSIVAKKLEQGVYGDPLEIDPDTALLMEVQRTAGHVEWLRGRIRELGEAKGEGILHQYSDAFGIVPSVWWDMYQKERQHLVRVSKAAIDAGVAIRQVEIAQQQAQMMAMVMANFISDPELGLDYMQQLNAKKLIRNHLERVTQADVIDLEEEDVELAEIVTAIEHPDDDEEEVFN